MKQTYAGMYLTLFFVMLCSGCTNLYTKFYHDTTGGIDLTTDSTVILPTGTPTIYSGTNLEDDKIDMLENGYRLLGYSSFNAGNVSQDQLFEQAKNVDAESVIFYSHYTNTISGTIPITLPDNKTTTTDYSGNVYDSNTGGSAFYNGTATSTTYGTQTIDIPYSENRYDYMATFWIKSKPRPFGAYLIDLPANVREEIGSNKGALVYAVVKGSPAFMGDILKGDVIKKINIDEVMDHNTCIELLHEYAGKTISVKLLRGNKTIYKKIKLLSSAQ